MPPDAVLAGYQQAVTAVRQRVLVFAEAMWAAMPAYRDAQADQLIARLVPRVLAGQVQVANLTATYMAAMTDTTPVPVDREAVTMGRGVDPEQVYRRPMEQVWTGLAQGQTLDAAVAEGARRLQSLVATDMQMAKVRQSDVSLQHAKVQAYRRVLKGAKNCALCVIASTSKYYTGRLSPIHPGCDCDVAPADGGWSEDRVIAPELLEDAHGAVEQIAGIADRGGRAVDYRKLLLVREHGEIGDVLTWRHQQFTSLADIPKYKPSARR
ncbi:VG15 protein [Gordonia tangerina]|uniref:Phage protein n=1 Tax=Gordonia tangerina TaxID=2911060 RepID=A0ABS9DU21_9ACTN|nr:hypothetical protein [Gordonia tangerina]MCF3941328.1 hypothetical protein [Gordonia tangerina]